MSPTGPYFLCGDRMALLTLNLTVPDTLMPQILTALRSNHPDITTGIADPLVLHAVVKYWIKTEMMTYHATQAGADAFEQAQKAMDNARKQAGDAADTIS